jgi:hypothetical protein
MRYRKVFEKISGFGFRLDKKVFECETPSDILNKYQDNTIVGIGKWLNKNEKYVFFRLPKSSKDHFFIDLKNLKEILQWGEKYRE